MWVNSMLEFYIVTWPNDFHYIILYIEYLYNTVLYIYVIFYYTLYIVYLSIEWITLPAEYPFSRVRV
jgi:hypothetical protein